MSKLLGRLAVKMALGALAGLAELGCGGAGRGSPGAPGSAGVSSAGNAVGGSAVGGSSMGGSGVGQGGTGGSAVANASDGTPTLGDSLAEGCIAYALAVCMRNAECGQYSPSECLNNVASECPDLVASPGATRTPAGLKACAEVFKTLPCDQVVRGLRPDCVTPGLRARGEPCTYPSQCSSLECESAGGDTTCGKCAIEVGEGESCATDDVVCGPGTYCASGVCTAFSQIGPNQVCTFLAQSPCVAGYYCAGNGPNATAGVCTPLPPIGQSCGSGYLCAGEDSDQAYCAEGLICRANPGVGEPCGVRTDFDLSGFHCATGLVCSGADPGRSERGTCVPLPQVGEPCIIPPEARIEGCATGLHCDAQATPPVCAAPGKPGAACALSYQCEAGLACGCALPPCDQPTCATLRYAGEPCSPTDLTNRCHPAFDCKDGTCKPAEPRGLFAQACSP